MSGSALKIIHEEHSALSAMLRSMSMLLLHARREGVMPDFDVLRAMVLYADEFPQRLHHDKETRLLFPKVLERAPALASVIQALEREHEAAEASIRELQHALLAFEVLGEPRREAFERAVERYVSSYLRHMVVEENEVLPVARRVLNAEDWAELDAAFAANRDPLTGHDPEDVYRPLFRKIVMSAPAPIGLGVH